MTKRWQHLLLWLVTLALCGGVALGGNNLFVPPDWLVTLVDANGVSLISGGAVKVTGGGGGGSSQVEGRAANGAAVVGNPVLMGGWDLTNVHTLLTGGSGDLVVTTAGGSGFVVDTELGASGAAADATTNASFNAGTGRMATFLFDATAGNWNRQRGDGSGRALGGAPSTTGNITANGQTVTLNVDGSGFAYLQISGTWTGTISFQVAADGVNYTAVRGSAVGTGVSSTSTTVNGQWRIAAGCGTVQAISTAAMTGTAVVTLCGSIAGDLGSVLSQGLVASGAASVGNPVLVGGKDGSGNAQALLVDTSGRGIQGQATGTGTLGSLNATVSVNTGGAPQVLAQFVSTAPVLTVTFQGSNDNFANVFTVPFYLMQTSLTSSSPLGSIANPASGLYVVQAGGVAQVRAIATAYTSGSIVATLGSTFAGQFPSMLSLIDASFGQHWANSTTQSADAQSANSYNGLVTSTVLYGHNGGANGTALDRIRTANGAFGTTGTGLLGTGLLGFNTADSSYYRLLTASAANPNLLCELRSGATGVGALGSGSDTLGNGLGWLGTASSNYGFNGTTWERIRTASATGVAGGTVGFLASAPMLWNGTGYQPSQNAPTSAVTTGTGLLGVGVQGKSVATGNYDNLSMIRDAGDAGSASFTLATATQSFNGVNYDRTRNNIDVSLTTQTGATTTFTSADQTNFNGGHIVVVLDMTVIGTGSVTLEIDNKDVISGKYYSILTGAAVVGNSTNVYSAGPALPATANVSANAILSRTFRIKVTANNANATTYTVGYSLACN